MLNLRGMESWAGLQQVIERFGGRMLDGVAVANDEGECQAAIDNVTLQDVQVAICAEIDAHARMLREKVTASVSPAEMASWAMKSAEARAFQITGNPSDAAPLLTIEAATRGVPLSDIVTRVLANALSLATLEATIAGVSGRHRDTVKSYSTIAEVLSYDWRAGWPSA